MSEEEQTGSGKKRVNLYLDEKLVQKCKDLGVNLSRVTTDILEGVPDSSNTTEAAYKKLFEKMLPIQLHYDVSVEIGSGDYEGLDLGDIYHDTDGRFTLFSEVLSKDVEHAKIIAELPYGKEFRIEDLFKFLKSKPDFNLYAPSTIFSNFIQAIKDKKEKDQRKIHEIERIARIITAIEPDLLPQVLKEAKK